MLHGVVFYDSPGWLAALPQSEADCLTGSGSHSSACRAAQTVDRTPCVVAPFARHTLTPPPPGNSRATKTV